MTVAKPTKKEFCTVTFSEHATVRDSAGLAGYTQWRIGTIRNRNAQPSLREIYAGHGLQNLTAQGSFVIHTVLLQDGTDVDKLPRRFCMRSVRAELNG